MARYGLSFVIKKSDSLSRTVIAVPYMITWKLDRVITTLDYNIGECHESDNTAIWLSWHSAISWCYTDATWATWCLKSPATKLFSDISLRLTTKKISKPALLPVCDGFFSQRVIAAESVHAMTSSLISDTTFRCTCPMCYQWYQILNDR